MAANLRTFQDAYRRTTGRRITAMSMAGQHLTSAHGTDNWLLSALHLDLADAHARAAVMWGRAADSYDAALNALYERAEQGTAEAFWRALDAAVPVAA